MDRGTVLGRNGGVVAAALGRQTALGDARGLLAFGAGGLTTLLVEAGTRRRADG